MIVVHIGLRKSGSSTLQMFFAKNRVALEAHSINFPKIALSNHNHHNIAHEIANSPKFDPHLGSLSDIVEYWRHAPSDTMVLTSEVFEGSNHDAVSRLKEGLSQARQNEEFRIVLVVRDLVELIPSSYAQKIKFGNNSYDFDSFFRRRMLEDRVNYYETASVWAAVFGWENMRVRSLDPGHLVNGDLVDDFLTILGVDLTDKWVSQLNRAGIRNMRPGWRVLEAMRALYNDSHGLEPGHPVLNAVLENGSEKNFGYLAMRLGEKIGWNADKGLYLTRDQAQQCLDIYRAAITSLNEHVPEKLPAPVSLEERGFVERSTLPCAELIPGEEIKLFYDRLAERWFKPKRGKGRKKKARA